LGPSFDWQQEAFGHTQDAVNIAVDFLWPCIAPVVSTDGVDGLHLTSESEKKLGAAVAAKVKEILK
jgi:hypothetical protein